MRIKITTSPSSLRRGRIPRIAVAKGLLLLALAGPAAAVVRVDTDISRAPAARTLAPRAQQLAAAWGPRINALLYGAAQGATVENVKIVFEPGARDDGALSYVRDGVIHMAATAGPGMDALLIHDLTHLYQHDLPEGKWLIEGIADYIAYVQFAQTLAPRLQIDAEGNLRGYGSEQPFLMWLQDNRVDLRQRGYLAGNQVTASFLHWVASTRDPDIVRRLSTAIRDGKYQDSLWSVATGASLDTLWQAFLRQ